MNLRQKEIIGVPKVFEKGPDIMSAPAGYHWKKGNIPNLLDESKTLENQAKQAFDLRNTYRTQARGYMSDRSLAEFLEGNEPNLTWEGYVDHLINNKGLSGDDVWNYIINSASSGREGVDALFKL